MSSQARVLIIRLSSLGDVALTAPVYAAVKSAWPRARVAVLTKPEYAPLLKGHPCVDEVLAFEGILPSLKLIRQKSFTHLLDLHGNWRAVVLSLFSGIPSRLRYDKAAWERRKWVYFKSKSPVLKKHTLDRYLEKLPLWGIPIPSHPETALPTDEKTPAEFDFDPKKLLIGVHVGSRWPTKRWPEERFARLIRRLKMELQAEVVLIGGPEDSSASSRIVKLAEVPCQDLTGKTDLRQMPSILARFNLFITNDSGPMHLAAACGVPVLAIFGSTTKELGFFPYGPGHKVVEVNLACRPCHPHGRKKCPLGHFMCMNLITVEQVFQTARQMLFQQSPITSHQSLS